LPGLSVVPPTDRDEARFIQATQQMLETGDVVNIRFQSEPRTKKPVDIHWLQVMAVKAFGNGDVLAVWAYRLPSAIAAWLAVLCTFLIGRRLFDTSAGLVAAGLTACTLLTVVEAHLAKADSTLLLTVVLAQLSFVEFYLAPDQKSPPFRIALMFWVAIGAGLLIKGPITIAVIAATAFALSIADRNVRWLRGL
jgi:4-amino-4-deoxy-L-arabinose transferase-like glycosyltransferase